MTRSLAEWCFVADPLNPDPINGGDRLRSLEDDRYNQRRPGQTDAPEGLRGLSTAWQQNRSTEYLLRKSWSDPLARTFFIVVVCVIGIGVTVLLLQ